MKEFREKLARYKYEYDTIGNCLCELERDKELLNKFRLYEEQREEGFETMHSGKILPEIPSISNTSKSGK